MTKKYKYEYWHIILKSYDDRFRVGELLSNNYKMDYKKYELFNMKTFESKVVCEVEYIGRTLTDMPKDERMAKLKELQNKWELSNPEKCQ